MKSRKENTYAVPALDKGLDVLEALALARAPQSLTELGRALRRTPSELFRMLNVLERRGFIAREPVSERYHLTLKLFELAHTHSPVDQLLKVALPPMYKLAEKIRESCHLCVLHNNMLVVVAQAESPEPVRLSVEVGDRVAPLRTASGRVLAAFLAREEREQFLAADATFAEMKEKEQVRLEAELGRIRKDGFLLVASSRRAGLDVSCIVGNASVGVTAALGVPFLPGTANSGKERSLIPAVQACAERITRALGFTPTGTKRRDKAARGGKR
jgi:DNA-binding IclR family transcriptional regulator